MTIVYLGNKFPPEPFDEDYEHIHYYRDLYEGNHKDIFPRAGQIGSDTQVSRMKLKRANYRYSKQILKEQRNDPTTHYVVVNISSAIAELPADLINRSLGNISADTEKDNNYLAFVEELVKRSNIQTKLWPAIVQHQVDGGIAYRVRRSELRGTWFEWITSDLYYEHEDGLGADISWIEEADNEKYLRVERQRLDSNGLTLTQHIFKMSGDKVEEELDFSEYARENELDIEELVELAGVTELMSGYIANDETILRPRGRSALRNIDVIQEEINWTVTRDSVVFEKHGKPKLAIPRRLWDTVANSNDKNYGSRFVRNADLEVVSYDENNGAVPMYITWNAQTEQSFKHVSRLIDYMLAISKTAPTAVGLGSTTGAALSAKAIIYEWIQSVIKSEAIRDKFDMAIKDSIRKCTLLENHYSNANLPIDEPVIEWMDMLPKANEERDTEESKKYTDGVQSLETTVRNLHPDWSEDSIQAEIDKILDEQVVKSVNPTYVQPPKTEIGNGEEDNVDDENGDE